MRIVSRGRGGVWGGRGGGFLRGLQAVGDGGRLFLGDEQSITVAQSYRIYSVQHGVMQD